MSGLGYVAPMACYQLPLPMRCTAFGDSGCSAMNMWAAVLSLKLLLVGAPSRNAYG